MPLRDWGLGLEELTEYYHRYGLYFTDFGINKTSQNWFMTRGVLDQTPQSTTHKITKKSFGFWSPTEIDLVGLRINHKCQIEEVRLIQCKEHINSDMVRKIAESFLMPKLAGIIWEARKNGILTKYVTYVNIDTKAKKLASDNDIELLSFDTMVEKLLQVTVIFERLKRKGFAREPTLWMLRSLKKAGFFDKKLIQKIENSLDKQNH